MATLLFISEQPTPPFQSKCFNLLFNDPDFIPNVGDIVSVNDRNYAVTARHFCFRQGPGTAHSVIVFVQSV